MLILSFDIPVPEVLSENFLYRPGFKNRHSFLYLDPKIGQYKEFIATHISNTYDLSCIPVSITGILSEYRFYMNPDTFWNRDVTNAVKAVEDAIFSVFKRRNPSLDDSQVISSTAVKIASKTPLIQARFAFLDNPDYNQFLMTHSIFNLLLGDTCESAG